MEIENAPYFHRGEPFRQHDTLEITSLKLFLYVEMRYKLILLSLAVFQVCFMIRDIANELVPDFACCIMNFYGFSAVQLYFYVDLRCLDYDFSHWLYIIAYFRWLALLLR